MKNELIISRPRLSVKVQALAALIAIACAVALPQVLHLAGVALGSGAALGEVLLPMHISIIMVGLLAGPYAGAAAGLLSPLLSFMLTGMPRASLLPFMMIELCVYGLAAGLLSNVKLPTIAKVLAVQIAGRAVRAIAILIAVYAFGNTEIAPSIILTSITAGVWGIALQLVVIPLIVNRVRKASVNEK